MASNQDDYKPGDDIALILIPFACALRSYQHRGCVCICKAPYMWYVLFNAVLFHKITAALLLNHQHWHFRILQTETGNIHTSTLIQCSTHLVTPYQAKKEDADRTYKFIQREKTGHSSLSKTTHCFLVWFKKKKTPQIKRSDFSPSDTPHFLWQPVIVLTGISASVCTSVPSEGPVCNYVESGHGVSVRMRLLF